MIYTVTNITHTSDDQHRRGHRLREFRKGRVQIGPRNILEGRSATFSQQMYESYKDRIEQYLKIGMIRLTKKEENGSAEEVEVVLTDVTVDSIDESDGLGVPAAGVSIEPEVAVSEEPVDPEAVSDEPTAPESSVIEVAPKKKGRPPKEK